MERVAGGKWLRDPVIIILYCSTAATLHTVTADLWEESLLIRPAWAVGPATLSTPLTAAAQRSALCSTLH